MRGKFSSYLNLTPKCEICGRSVRLDFAFDMSEDEDGSAMTHPDCFIFTHSDRMGFPSRKMKKGQHLVHTCGNPMCVKPDHLEIAKDAIS